MRKTIKEALKERKVLVSDGAWGTFLQRSGLKPGECPEEWCLSHPDVVKGIAQSYVDAGSDMIETNSFGGTSFKLSYYGLGDKVSEINEAAARLSREAAGDDVCVIASVGPTGKLLLMGDVTEEEMYNSFKEQVIALERGGADAICVETMTDATEASLAVRAAKENTSLEIISTFTFDVVAGGEYRTMMGVSPTEAATAAIQAGADIIGTNCGNGLGDMVGVITEIRKAFEDVPILVHANAGLPCRENGVDTFPETPEQMAALVPAILQAGANIIGGCCGTTPQHIAAIKQKLKQVKFDNIC